MENKEIQTVIVDGVAIDVNRSYTPSEYFEKIKAMKNDCTEDDLLSVLTIAEAQMKKFTILKQTEAANICGNYIKMFQKEIKAIRAGFNTYVLKHDVEECMKNLTDRCVFCTEIADYPRNIPDDVADRIIPHMDIFDHIYIVFTDYTQKTAKKVATRTKEKDPIMFGAFDIVKGMRPIVGPRFYYIGDWVDEYCDLTLEQMLGNLKKNGVPEPLKTLRIPDKSDDLNKMSYEYSKEVANVSEKDVIKKPE